MKRNELTLEERLIVAVDVTPDQLGGGSLDSLIGAEIRQYKELGVTLKFNSILRVLGYEFIRRVHGAGLKVFADLKLNDIPNTLRTDGKWLSAYAPDFLTVMCSSGTTAMDALVEALPGKEILGVTVLTSMCEADCRRIHGCPPSEAVMKLFDLASAAGVHGLICSPYEVFKLRECFGNSYTYNCSGIRPNWYQSDTDDQKRVMTPKEAILAGADRIIVGRPIHRAKDRRDAVQRTLEEIQAGLDERY